VIGALGSGIGMLSGILKKVNKGRAPKDLDKAAKGLAERIKGGNEDAKLYAQSLGIDPDQVTNDDNLEDLIKMKMGG